MPIVSLLSPDSRYRVDNSDSGHQVIGPAEAAELIAPIHALLANAHHGFRNPRKAGASDVCSICSSCERSRTDALYPPQRAMSTSV
jgi:hypothetical protein